MNGLSLELDGPASYPSYLLRVLRASVRHTEAASTRLGASVDVTDAGFKRSKTAALRVQTLPPDIAITSVPIQVMP